MESVGYGRAADAVAKLQTERAKTLRELLPLADEACRQRVEWYGRPQTVNAQLRGFTGHVHDHFQHLHRLLQARGHMMTEAQLLLIQANAAMAEFEALVLSLDDDAFEATGPVEGDWSARQILEHVIDNERKYRENIVTGLAAQAAAEQAVTDDPEA
jgi:hypothetical protein